MMATARDGSRAGTVVLSRAGAQRDLIPGGRG